MADVHARGIRFNVVRMGQGEPTLVFVHGMLIDNHASFYMSIAPAIAKHASVVLYDLRGHGKSEQSPGGYAIDDMAADLAGLLDALQLRDAIVVGHSYGGTIALRFAARFPERTRGLVLLEALPDASGFGKQVAATIGLTGAERDRKVEELFGHWLAKHNARGGGADDVIASAGRNTEGLDTDGRVTVERIVRFTRRRASPLVATVVRLRDETSLVHDLATGADPGDEVFAHIACPVLALYGEHSDLRADGERLAQRLPQCRLEIVAGCAHGILFHATAQVRDAVLAWIAEGAGASAQREGVP